MFSVIKKFLKLYSFLSVFYQFNNNKKVKSTIVRFKSYIFEHFTRVCEMHRNQLFKMSH